METVRSERDGFVTTVILDRPHVRNAVDRPTAEALAILTVQAEVVVPALTVVVPV